MQRLGGSEKGISAAENDIVIERANRSDIQALATLAAELGEIDRQAAERNVSTALEDPSVHLYVSRSEGNAIGFAGFTTRRTIIHAQPCGLLDELIVSREYRGKGIGKALIAHVIAACRERGCCELEVSTLKSNKRAREFYIACGFEEEAVLLELDLDESR